MGNEDTEEQSIEDLKENYRKIEVAFKECKERFRAIAESTVDAIITTNINGNILFFNDSIIKLFGYSKEELSGKQLTVLIPDRFKDDYINELERFKSSGEHKLLGRVVRTTGKRKDNTEFPFEMSLSKWKSGENTYFTAIIRDISEREKTGEALRESEEKYKTLFESNPDYTILVGLDGVILDFNVAAEQIIGKSKEGLIGKHFLDLGIFPKEELDLHSEKFSQTLKHGNITPYRARIIDKNGKIRWVLTQITTIKKDDTLSYFLVIGRDITEYIKAEEAIKKSEEKYRKLVEKFLTVSNEIIQQINKP